MTLILNQRPRIEQSKPKADARAFRESMPASIAEVVALYQTNARVSADGERELNGFTSTLSALPTPKEFQSVAEELNSLAACDLRFREEVWGANLRPEDLKEFDRMLETANKTIEFSHDNASWRLEAIQAGRAGRAQAHAPARGDSRSTPCRTNRVRSTAPP